MAVTAPQTRRNESPRTVTILGSTGSVGCNTIDLISRQPELYVVEALTARRNVELLIQQAMALRPAFVAVADPECYEELRDGLVGTGIEVAAGPEAIVEAAARQADWVMAAIVGAAGLEPTMAAVRRGAIIGLANKECLVCAGDIMMAEIRRHGATLLPVDSEHNAIFQVFDFANPDNVRAIILTASGGPFRCRSLEEMEIATPQQAVAHPNWDMGAKISVDSATMMNKGLEMIEAYHLFPVQVDQIEVVVHPQSVVHSLVAYVDGSVLAQLGLPDMRTPISYALGWPDRMDSAVGRLSLTAAGTLTFEAPDEVRFPALRLAREALQQGGVAPVVLNAANEVAVHRFLDLEIGFLDIARVVEQVLESMSPCALTSIDDVLEVDRDARERARHLAGNITTRTSTVSF